MRESFNRERNREKELGRSGAGLSKHKPWKYAAVMGFLDRFMEYRDSRSNFQRPATTSPVSQEDVRQTAASATQRVRNH